MTLIIPTGFAQVAYRCTLLDDPEPMITTVGLDMSTADPDPTTAAADLLDQWQAAFPPANTFSQYNLQSVTLRIGNGTSSPDLVEVNSPQPGTAVGNPPPQNVTLLVRKLSTLGGRRGRGRMYVPLWMQPESTINANGFLDASARTARQSEINSWLGGVFGFVILHSTGITSTPVPTPITSFVVDARVATQRRRLRP